MRSSLIPLDYHQSELDLRSLEYIRNIPGLHGDAIFQGPFGLPLKLAFTPSFTVRPAAEDIPSRVATLMLVEIEPKATPDGRILLTVSHGAPVAKLRLREHHIDHVKDLPLGTRKLAEAVIELMAKHLDPEIPRLRRGTFEDLTQLLQDYADLVGRTFRLHAALDEIMLPTTTCNGLASEIACWHHPIATRSNLAHDLWVDERTAAELAVFRPQKHQSGHERLESAARLETWLKAHRAEIDTSRPDIRKDLHILGLSLT